MSERFSLKWNDFQSIVSQSFSVLRREEDFYDVTLVSDDQTQIPAHKLVLSASSKFFKSILKRNPHSHPLLYLSGVNSANLNLILDYIYQGEVQVNQEHLESFLEVAQRLKIEGVNTFDVDSGVSTKKDEEIKTIVDPKSVDIPSDNSDTRSEKKIVIATDNSAAEEAIRQYLGGESGAYFCKVCDYSGKQKYNLTRHIETHIGGLS